MFGMTCALRWSWVLGIALFLPVDLPAGGGQRFEPQVSRWKSSSSFLAGDCCHLLATPFALAPRLRTLKLGTPIRVLRRWHSPNGEEWLQVQISKNEIFQSSSAVRRGWVNV